MRPETLDLIELGGADQGDVIGVARIAAIQATKLTADLISCDTRCPWHGDGRVRLLEKRGGVHGDWVAESPSTQPPH